MQCLQLFRYLHAANDEAFCASLQIGKTSDDKVIDFQGTNLTVYDVECVAL